jgi:hypothetical protein
MELSTQIHFLDVGYWNLAILREEKENSFIIELINNNRIEVDKSE